MKVNAKPQVAILDAGIAGMSAGWLLQKRGISYAILEKESYAGELARSFLWKGFPCDFTAHRLFTTDENVLKQLLKLVPMGRHIRRSKIYIHRRRIRDLLFARNLIRYGIKLASSSNLHNISINLEEIHHSATSEELK